MKKLILSLSLVISNIYCTNQENFKIINYEPTHKDTLIKIAFEDPYMFFSGSSMVKKGFMTADLFELSNKEGLEAIFNDKLRIKKVLIVDNKVAGFIEFFKAREQSLESIKKLLENQKQPYNEKIILAQMPNIKKTDAECEVFAKIEAIAITRDLRKKGFGKILLKNCLEDIRKNWQDIKKVELDCNTDNKIAKKLYESFGFTPSKTQNLPPFLEVLNYEKLLN